MATVAQNNLVVAHTPPIPYPILRTGSSLINAGDLVYFDTSAKVIKVMDDAVTHAAFFAGMALNGSFIQPYSVAQYEYQVPVLSRGVVRLQTTAAESYAEGDPLYFGGDAQTITKVDPGSGVIVGYAKLGPGVTALTGAAGVKLEVLLAPKYPISSF